MQGSSEKNSIRQKIRMNIEKPPCAILRKQYKYAQQCAIPEIRKRVGLRLLI